MAALSGLPLYRDPSIIFDPSFFLTHLHAHLRHTSLSVLLTEVVTSPSFSRLDQALPLGQAIVTGSLPFPGSLFQSSSHFQSIRLKFLKNLMVSPPPSHLESYLVFAIIHWGGFSSYLHFVNKGTKALRNQVPSLKGHSNKMEGPGLELDSSPSP